MITFHRQEVEGNRAGFRTLSPDAVPERLFGVLRQQALQLDAFSCSRKADRVERKTAANSAHALEVLMSTMRTAAILGRGASTPKRRAAVRQCSAYERNGKMGSF